MPKIKNLIEVPPVKTVIELATVRDASAENLAQLIKLTETFVVTEDIERCPDGQFWFREVAFFSGVEFVASAFVVVESDYSAMRGVERL
jgi:hypothetical protein